LILIKLIANFLSNIPFNFYLLVFFKNKLWIFLIVFNCECFFSIKFKKLEPSIIFLPFHIFHTWILLLFLAQFLSKLCSFDGGNLGITFWIDNQLDICFFHGFGSLIQSNIFPCCSNKNLIQVFESRVIDNVSGIVFELLLMEEENGFCSWVMDAWVVSSLHS